jgi:cytochrome oxidase Cu insertion factor (SCO1/SenC/PrrC family)
MKNKNIVLYVMLLLAVILAACGGTAPDATEKNDDMMMEDKPADEAMVDEPHDDMMSDDAMDESSSDMMSEDAMMESPAWFSVSLTDVNSGETFTINDLKGKVILVETMAVWCSNCLKQQMQVKALHQTLGERDDFVSIGIDIDSNEDSAKLKGFVDANGFDWKYVVSPAEVSRDISSLYGGQFLNPPSTPMLIIDRHGNVHPLPFGIKSADDLLQALQPFLDEAI